MNITFKKGLEPNRLEILVDSVDIVPHAVLKKGFIDSGYVLKFGRYDLENTLIQMLNDYGKDELIKRINLLD